MSSLSKQICVFAISCMLFGCATTDNENVAPGDQSGNMKMTATSCMSEATSSRQQCEQKCPKATGNEHFSMQHRLAMEHAACTERCAGEMESEAMRCKANR